MAKLNGQALSDIFYIMESSIPDHECRDFLKIRGAKIDEDGDYFWKAEEYNLYRVIFEITTTYDIEIH